MEPKKDKYDKQFCQKCCRGPYQQNWHQVKGNPFRMVWDAEKESGRNKMQPVG